MQIVLHNQDNREHDLLDSDDYYQFQGGLTAAVRALTGKNPQTYFGDHSNPENPRSPAPRGRVCTVLVWSIPSGLLGDAPWLQGAFEMAATVDYLPTMPQLGVEDHMYQGVAAAYLFDSPVQTFIQEKNPWALRDERLLKPSTRSVAGRRSGDGG